MCKARREVWVKTQDVVEHFPKILQKLSEGQKIVSEHFPKISEDFRPRTDVISIIQEHI